MMPSGASARDRTVLFLTTPALWPTWPFLPMIRQTSDGLDLGVVFDAWHACGLPGYSATVFRTNLLTLPSTFEQFLALPKEVFDSAEEVADAGWLVD